MFLDYAYSFRLDNNIAYSICSHYATIKHAYVWRMRSGCSVGMGLVYSHEPGARSDVIADQCGAAIDQHSTAQDNYGYNIDDMHRLECIDRVWLIVPACHLNILDDAGEWIPYSRP